MVKRAVKITLISLAIIIVVITTTIGVALNFIFTPEKLTPTINKALQEIVTKGTAKIGSVELTFFSSFPNFSLVMDSVVVADSSQTNKLLNIKQASLNINPIAYLTSKEVVVSNITFDSPFININFDSLGVSNLDILNFSSQTDTTTQTTTNPIKSIDIKKIAISNGNISITDARNSSITQIKRVNFTLKGKLSDSISDLQTNLSAEEINMEVEKQKLLSNFSFTINTDFRFNRDSLTLHTDIANVTIGNLLLTASGSIQIDTTKKLLINDLKFGLATPSLSTLIGYIPQTILKPNERFSASGDVKLDGTIKGIYGANSIPTISAHTTIKDGSFRFENMAYGVEKLETNIALKIDGEKISQSYIDINNFILKSNAGVDLNIKSKLSNIFNNYNAQFEIISELNLDRLTEIFPLAEGIVVKGANSTNIKGKFTKQIIQRSDFGSIYLDGKSEFKNLLVSIDGSKIADSTRNSYLYVEMKQGSFNFGNNSNVAKTTDGMANLAADINFSGVGFRNKKGMDVFLSNVELSAAAKVSKDTVAITPMAGKLSLGRIDFAIADTIKAHLTSSSATISIEPSKQNLRRANIALSLRTDSIDIDAIQSKTTASLKVAAIKLNLNSDSTITTKYSINGTIGFGGFKAFSELFPINISMPGSLISFEGNRINLQKSSINIGNSNAVLTGWVENLLSNLLGTSNNNINSNLAISSKSIDLTQIYAASLKSSTAQKSSAEIEKTPSEPLQILLIPKNISSSFSLNVNKISFDDMIAENIDGDMEIKNGKIALSNFNFVAAGANMEVSGKYHPLSDSLASATFNLNANKIVIKELVKFIPAVDSIMPMLKSFEGSINFDMAARCNINRDMTINLPSLESVMSIKGTELVLMDGDTFRKISKMLLFKNKEKNIIDSLGVNVVVHKHGKIDVPPFEVEIDRYRAIVGGTQTLDFNNFDINYAYNISIIKSPLPIKAGVDIKGKNGDFDFKITKAKLKRADFTEIQTNIDSIKNSILTLNN